jgi:hypothetical protein
MGGAPGPGFPVGPGGFRRTSRGFPYRKPHAWPFAESRSRKSGSFALFAKGGAPLLLTRVLWSQTVISLRSPLDQQLQARSRSLQLPNNSPLISLREKRSTKTVGDRLPALSSGGNSDEKSICSSSRVALPVPEILLRSGTLLTVNPASSRVRSHQEIRYQRPAHRSQERAHTLLKAAGRSSRHV